MTCVVSKICSHADGCDMRYRYTVERCSAFEERQTNFTHITVSPEALAEFIGSVLDCCSDEFGVCKRCPLDKTCIADKGFKQSALEWLKQESK